MKKLALVVFLTSAIFGCSDTQPPATQEQELKELQTAMDEAYQTAQDAKKSANLAAEVKKIPLESFKEDLYFGDYRPDQYPDLNNLLGSDGIARLQTFEKKAVEDLYSNRDCDKPYSNGVSMERTTADNIVVFFDCNNGNRFYISELELK